MKNIARKLSALLLVFVVSAAALCPAFAATASLPSLPSGQCVVDDANVLSSSTVQTIQDLNTQLDASCKGAQIGVLTVDYTGSVSTEDYAVEAANTWQPAAWGLADYLSDEVTGQPGQSMGAYWLQTRG